MKKLIEQFNTITGLRFWYRCNFIYKDKRGNIKLEVLMTVSFKNKRLILKPRRIKKAMNPLSFIDSRKLCNGTLDFEPVCYLGYFKDV